jgi:hypothetical protein
MEAVGTSETSVCFNETSRRCIPSNDELTPLVSTHAKCVVYHHGVAGHHFADGVMADSRQGVVLELRACRSNSSP